jgi:hypothetical protein
MFFLSLSLSFSRLDPHDDRHSQFECFEVVRIVDREFHGGKSATEISSIVESRCASLYERRKNVCLGIASNQTQRIIDLLTEKKRPDFICEVLGYPSDSARERAISKEKCLKIVESFRSDTNETEPEPRPLPLRPIGLREDVARPVIAEGDPRPFGLRDTPRKSFAERHLRHGPPVCRKVEPEDRMPCLILARFVKRGMAQELKDGASAGEICKKLEDRGMIRLTE